MRKNIIGTRVRQARRNAKPPITQLDLVARLGLQKMKVDQSIVSKIENGTRPVYDYEILKIAKADAIVQLSVRGKFNSSSVIWATRARSLFRSRVFSAMYGRFMIPPLS